MTDLSDDGLCGARGQWRTDARAVELYRFGVEIIVSCTLPRGHDGDHDAPHNPDGTPSNSGSGQDGAT